MARIRGVPEVPLLPNVDPQHRRFLQDLREQVVALTRSQIPMAPPTNFKVTPEGFGNLLQWTRSPGADYYEVLWATVPTNNSATVVDVGDAQQWFDNIGQSGIKRWYWVRARRRTGARSLETAAISGTSLASGTGVNPPPPLPPSGGSGNPGNTQTGGGGYERK